MPPTNDTTDARPLSLTLTSGTWVKVIIIPIVALAIQTAVVSWKMSAYVSKLEGAIERLDRNDDLISSRLNSHELEARKQADALTLTRADLATALVGIARDVGEIRGAVATRK